MCCSVQLLGAGIYKVESVHFGVTSVAIGNHWCLPYQQGSDPEY